MNTRVCVAAASWQVADVSVGIASLMGMAFCVCAYCFFREDLISAAHKVCGPTARRALMSVATVHARHFLWGQ